MSFEEPTQRLPRPSPPQPSMPGPLDVTRHDPVEPVVESDPTDVLPLDELLGPPEPEAGDAAEAADPPEPAERPASSVSPASTEDADAEVPLATNRPARTPMPVVSVRPDGEPDRGDAAVARSDGEPGSAALAARRLRADGAAAVQAGAAKVIGWLGRDDNALTLVTALVAILLLSVVAAFGS